jgi:hypothetical protein
MLRRFLIERRLPGVGQLAPSELGEAARRSNGALAKLTGVQWQQSFVARDRTFCVYLADSEAVIREHARLAGFPVDRITEIPTLIDPTTERACPLPLRD